MLTPWSTRATDEPQLTDDALTEGPPSPSVRDWLRRGTDRLAGADPGLSQLRTASLAILGVMIAVGLIYGFVTLTGASQLPAGSGPPAVVKTTNHALLIVSMLAGGLIAMMAGFTVADPSAREQLISTLLLPIPMLAAIGIGLELGSYRLLSLGFLVVVMTGSVYVRRFGPRGFAAGLLAFNGSFLGFFLHRQLSLHDLDWLAADLGLGIVSSLFVRFVLLWTNQAQTLARVRHSWSARAGRLLDLSASAIQAPPTRHLDSAGPDAAGPDAKSHDARAERIRRQVVRLNESTLIVEGQLVLSSPTSARLQAHELFGAELSLTNCARFCTALARVLGPRDEQLRDAAVGAITAARAEDWPRATALAHTLRERSGSTERVTTLAHRLGISIEQYATSRDRLRRSLETAPPSGAFASYEPAVQLSNGYLPGSAPVSTLASTTPGRGRFEHTTLPPYLRASIQIAIASTLAVLVGDVVSGSRLYWAVLATYLAFTATTNTGEQIRKALFRVAGTAIGIVTGDVLVRVTGGSVWAALPIVLAVLFLGIYLIRINYTFMVIGATMMLSLLYYQLGEFTWKLLLLRLGETAVGVGAVVVTVLVVFPLHPQRVLTAGVLLWFRSLSALTDACLSRLLGGDEVNLRPAVRELDASWASLEATAQPLRHATFGRNSAQLAEIRAVSSAARLYARSLADELASLNDPHLPAFGPAAVDLRSSTAAICERIETGRHGVYVRASALIERAARDLSAESEGLRSVLRDLTMLDGALARLAAALDMQVLDHDTDLVAGSTVASS